MMKKSLILILALVMTVSMVFAGCGKKQDDTKNPDTGESVDKEENNDDKTADTDTDDVLKIKLLINGNLGDKSFFDSAKAGLELIENKYGDKVVVEHEEMTYDETKWEPALLDASDKDYDIIIVGTYQMAEILQDVAVDYPDKRYIIFDSAVDYEGFDLPNVYSIEYKQNEGSFLAGVLATRITTSGIEKTNEDKKIGFIGGMENNVINDFLVGYIDGALYADKDTKVASSYIGGFDDVATAKEMSLTQYKQGGVDIGFNVAGQAGLGQIEAAAEADKYVIGVDSDQSALFAEDKNKSDRILTSVLKRVDQSLLRAIDMHIEGTLPYGEAESLGFKEKAIDIVDTNPNVPAEIMEELAEIEQKIIDGEIKVKSAFSMTQDEIAELRDSVK
jgi:basic membrane protein A and related proteins